MASSSHIRRPIRRLEPTRGFVFEDSSFERVEFTDCRLSVAVLPDVRLRNVTFRTCRLDSAALRTALAKPVTFDACDLRAADLYAADVTGADIVDCDLTGADLSQAKLAGARLHGSTLVDVTGAAALRDVTIDATQVVPVGMLVLDTLGITVTDR